MCITIIQKLQNNVESYKSHSGILQNNYSVLDFNVRVCTLQLFVDTFKHNDIKSS